MGQKGVVGVQPPVGQVGFTAPRGAPGGPFEPLTAPLNAPAVGTDATGNHTAVFYVVPPKALTEALSTTEKKDKPPASVILKTTSVLSGYKAEDPLSNVAVEKKAGFVFGHFPFLSTVTADNAFWVE